MTDPLQQQWLNDVYDSVYARHEGYNQDSVDLLSLLVMSDNAWSPAQDLPPARRRAVRHN